MSTHADASTQQTSAGWCWVPCPICGGAEHELVFESRNRLFGTDDVSCLRKCACGMRLTNPQPTEETLARLYSTQEYYTHAAPGLKERLRAKTRRWQLRGPLAGLRATLERATDISRFTTRFAPEHFALRRRMKMLDFGCGGGDIAVLGLGLGLEVVGVEPDAQARAAAAARGVRAVVSLDQLPSAERFDRIVIRHVLEHVPDPVGVLSELGSRLSPQGRLLVAVPNIEAHQAAVFGEHWIGYDMPRHLWHFSSETLRRAAEKAGLRVEWIGTVELRGFALKSLENTPEDRRAAAAGQRWSARTVEREGRGTEIVAVLSGDDGRRT
jgi:2-polyprenyl-3-methyl-5-hydroxy-6-metoxy-1,4-benzoquinol methylase